MKIVASALLNLNLIVSECACGSVEIYADSCRFLWFVVN